MPGYILTGAPGAGKTAVLRLLEINGHVVVEEAATDAIAIALANALGRAEPWHDHAFIDKSSPFSGSDKTLFEQPRPPPSSSTAQRCAPSF
jgi:predicted ATPase